MYKKMLVPLDGSELAEAVFPYAKEVAGRLDMDVVLLHVYSPEAREFVPMYQAYIEQAAQAIKRQIREVQQKTDVQSESEPTEVRGELITGCPAKEILRYAEKNAIDLILMTTHGHYGIKRWTMGSVADRVLCTSNTPILLVRADTTEETLFKQCSQKSMLVLLDGSELAESVLPHVEELAKQRGIEPVEVTLLRVCEPPSTPAYYAPELTGIPLDWGEYDQQVIDKEVRVIQVYLARVEKRLKDKNIRVKSVILQGKAAEEIVDYINKNPFQIIVMATHGRSGISRWVYGSVADRILHGVSSPIFLVRPQKKSNLENKETDQTRESKTLVPSAR